MGDDKENPSQWTLALPWALASLVCSYASACMTSLYGYYHWQIVFKFPHWEPPEHVREPMFDLFGVLDTHEIVFAVGAMIFAAVCTRYKPRWIGITVLAVAALQLFVAIFVQT